MHLIHKFSVEAVLFLGYFLFGGSDVVLIFQRGVEVELLHMGEHLLMGEAYANLKKNE